MSEQKKEWAARAVSMFKCGHCHGLHLRVELNDRNDVLVVLDPDQWAEIFMGDPEFRREVATRLQ